VTSEWAIVPSTDGALDRLEKRTARTVIRFDPRGCGSQVEVSINGGATWRYSRRTARSMAAAESIAEIEIDRWRADARRSRARRAPRGREETRGGRFAPERRTARDAAPPFVRWDDPAAGDLARRYIRAKLDPSIEGRWGELALFGVSVAIVRGFCLLPDGLGGIVIAEWNRTEARPPWSSARLRRALVRAETHGSLPWAVLLSTSAEGRDLYRAWRWGGGAGEGATS
jgi:hypothetical protein